MTNPTA